MSCQDQRFPSVWGGPMGQHCPAGVPDPWAGHGKGDRVGPWGLGEGRGQKMRPWPGVIQTDFNATDGRCQRRLHAILCQGQAGARGQPGSGVGWRGSPVPDGSVLPERGPQDGVAVGTQGAGRVPTQVPPVLPFDGDTAPLPELEEEILGEVPVAAHRPAARHVPELAPLACGESPGVSAGSGWDHSSSPPIPVTHPHLGSDRRRR